MLGKGKQGKEDAFFFFKQQQKNGTSYVKDWEVQEMKNSGM